MKLKPVYCKLSLCVVRSPIYGIVAMTFRWMFLFSLELLSDLPVEIRETGVDVCRLGSRSMFNRQV